MTRNIMRQEVGVMVLKECRTINPPLRWDKPARVILKSENVVLSLLKNQLYGLNRIRYLSWWHDIENTQYFWPEKKLTDEVIIAEQYNTALDKDTLFMGINYNGEFVGTIKLKVDERHNKAEFVVMVGDKTVQNKGVATRAVRLMIDYAFSVLSIRKLTAGTYDNNFAARCLWEKCGFIVEAIIPNEKYYYGSYVPSIFYAKYNPLQK